MLGKVANELEESSQPEHLADSTIYILNPLATCFKDNGFFIVERFCGWFLLFVFKVEIEVVSHKSL